jgi:hypothetical protein
MSSNKLNEIIASVAKGLENNEKLVTTILAAKLNKIAEADPHDQTVGSVARVLNKMSDNKKVFISKAEFRDLYNKFYTRNTKFAEYMQQELGNAVDLATPTYAPKQEKPISDTFDLVADPVLSNALASAFEKNASIKVYSKKSAEKAKEYVRKDLERWNVKASRVEVDAGNEHFIVVKADYDTPKGITSVLVPVEVSNDTVMEPSLFMANAGPKELNNSNVKEYVKSHAGVKLKVRSEDIVHILTKNAFPEEVVSDAELAFTKLNASKEVGGDFGSVLGLNLEAKSRNSEISIPKLSESDSFAAKLGESLALINIKFGKEKVDLGRNVIKRFMNDFGYKNAQINVLGADNTNVFYGVSIDDRKTSFKVPVKIEANKVLPPEILICSGSVAEFKKSSIQDLVLQNQTDFKVAAASSPQYGLKPSELIENVKLAVLEGNLSKAEDALNVIKESGDNEAYVIAFNEYICNINSSKKVANDGCGCSFIIKSASSQHAICGHTNLPLHKVYQDEHGNCLPKYRKNMEANYEGAFFMNSKIFG